MDETLQTVLTLRKHLNKDRYEIVCELMPCVQILLAKKSVPGQSRCRGSNSVEGIPVFFYMSGFRFGQPPLSLSE